MADRRGFMRAWVMSAGVLLLACFEAGSAAAAEKMSLNVLYPAGENARFDLDYYRKTHIPLAMQVMKASSVMLIEGVPNGATPAPFVMICHFEFDSEEALKAAMANPEMAKVRADVAHFTDIKPTVMVGKSR